MAELPAAERIILAIDTSHEADAVRLATVAQEAGARFVKLGLELSSATDWRYCSELAAAYDLDWVADAKLHDIPSTVLGAVRNIKGVEHPPFGITMHATAGSEAMRLAQEEAGEIKMLGVTILTSIKAKPEEGEELSEGERMYHVPVSQKVMELARDAVRAGVLGVVASPLEVGMIKRDPETSGLFAMIPGTRSADAEVQDQARVGTPGAAIRDGADLLVIGRQITQAKDPAAAYDALVGEIEAAL
jgi:orotidine-5'-phosphate decarboxylase